MKTVIGACIFLLLTAPAFSQDDPHSGNSFKNDICRNKGAALACLTFVAGFSAGMEAQQLMTNSGKSYCAPPGVTTGQKRDIFVKYLDDHPAELHMKGGTLLYISLARVFPCAANKEPYKE